MKQTITLFCFAMTILYSLAIQSISFAAVPTVTTTSVGSITTSSAVSGGNVTSNGGFTVTARGVCWSTSTAPTVALTTKTVDGSGTGTFISSFSALTHNTTYYVRAYATNSQGTSYGNELVFTTIFLTCGSSAVTAYHVAGSVAPVSKAVTYGTVKNIPGDTGKCWITRNLGADQQAATVNDVTEASAGWYWQFNRKQGYKHDGTTRTPNTAWITSISESTNWATANDPCALELGTSWRIPTYTEWYNVDNTGGWITWTGGFFSGIHIHAAGELVAGGNLASRGTYGRYWSSTQNSTTTANFLRMESGASYMLTEIKTYGWSVRCLNNFIKPTLTTTAASSVTTTSLITGGNITADGGFSVTARGVCWSTSPVPTISLSTKTSDGTGTGVFTTNLSGLKPQTTYYLRAYATNCNGTSYGNEITFTTLELICGTSTLTVYHVADSVAPVAKTVVYSTVTNIPGETIKCWITQNLGASQQATAVNDATEVSAGWYWQFNKKQGFKHDGTTRTPNTTWINSISENSDWVTTNDPCALEVGSGWRLPTNTEWNNVDNTGGWTNWTGAFTSGLKLHAGGFLAGGSGALSNRGANGYFWSSSQYNDGAAWDMSINSGGSNTDFNAKTTGFSVRCMRTLVSPTVSTTSVGSLTNSSAIASSIISDNGAGAITARGVCWSTTTGPTIALSTKTVDGTGSGAFTSNISPLNPLTTYYLRAYATNSAGTSYGNEMVFMTTDLNCGTSTVTAYHVAGSIAPVSKTVAYETVGNIPGETSKCWIARNLGASQQATAVGDATEPSAGWYWQFNRKQGFKHDGTTRTPATTWVTSIAQTANWDAVNDPCNLQLGTSWRIPTNTEYYNIDNIGGWTNWNGPWGSGLKLHAGGYLEYLTGNRSSIGTLGRVWSSTQNGMNLGLMLNFHGSTSSMISDEKACGLPLRCLRSVTLPNVSTGSVGSVSNSSAIASSTVTDNGALAITARGVCWSTTTGPTIALSTKTSDGIGSGAFTSNLNGLSPSTTYYIRAYATNSLGTTYGNELTFITADFSCGNTPVTAYHLAGSVAAVSKTVDYGTATNIPGETSKCWITRNLGASQQATAVTDDTEASAGWYWQFNRKQGYKHDGINRTPATTWINGILEESNWIAANDPCNIELGSAWVVPTYTEWSNIDNTGGWTNWNGPWNSSLKLHAAGFLDNTTGELRFRGAVGDTWSSTQLDYMGGYEIMITPEYCELVGPSKAWAFSVRCLRSLSLPTVSTSVASGVNNSSAIVGGTVSNNGGLLTTRGVCWSVTANPTILLSTKTVNGTGTGVFTSNLGGLSPNTTYYYRAYATNSMGTVYGNENTFKTSSFACGTSSVTIYHVADSVAPVSKSVVYGTVKNIPGDTAKCWITRNLGASQQATTVNDTTESSSGWYWQFNRKQGYKHNGTTRTPNTPWIFPISENSDWLNTNDPCKIELGFGWRIPTHTEWYNVDNTGEWTNLNGAWNSALKLHPAGYIWYNDGNLIGKGAAGLYWGGTQMDINNGNCIYFTSSFSNLSTTTKAMGLPIRCLNSFSKPTLTTSAIGTLAPTSAISGGNITDDGDFEIMARGVCWSTAPAPTIALSTKTMDGTGTGVFTSNFSGLDPETTYHLRAYATNCNGTAYGNEVTFTTPPFICGTTVMTVYHVADSVAPVTKTVTYSSTRNVPGVKNRCWITKNLGAEQQAGSVDDNTEASAGWYWPFSLKRGYKHDGVILTPNAVSWQTAFPSTDWLPENDPCRLELGSQWRIPTYNEWKSTDSASNWNNGQNPFNSPLKLHRAGSINTDINTGNISLMFRGVEGIYQSSTQDPYTNNAYQLIILAGPINVLSSTKSTAGSLRCLREEIPPTTANFTASPVYGSTPLEVHFTDQTTTMLPPLTWKWYFGDGDSSSVQNPVHIYHHDSADMVPYTVKLVVRDIKDSISVMTKTDYVKVCPQVYIPGGNVSGTWHSDSTYFIGGEIIVPYGQTLTIEPGTTVKFKADTRDNTTMAQPRTRQTADYGFMTVYGTLIAQGTAADSIRFTRAGNTGWWGLIHMTRMANQQNPFKYCTMEYASYLTDFTPAVDLAGLSLDSNSIAVTNCRFSNNYVGIRSDSSHSLIQYNNISGNTTGILTASHSAPVIKQNIFTGNAGQGIKVTNSGKLKVFSNTLVGNMVGLTTVNSDTVTVDNSILWNNTNHFNVLKLKVKYSCVKDSVYPGTGNIKRYPKFTNTPGDPYGLIWSNFPNKTDTALMSPCINTGDPDLNSNGTSWLTDPADRDPDMSRPEMGARYFHQNPLISTYNIIPAGSDSSSFDFGPIQITLTSLPHSFVVRNLAERIIECPLVFTGVAANQYILYNTNPILTLNPYSTQNAQVKFKPTYVGQQDAFFRAGVTGFQDSIGLQGLGQGTGTINGHVKTSTGLGVGGVTITIVKTDNPNLGATFTDITSSDGFYSATNIGLGKFSVTPSFNMSGISHTFNPPKYQEVDVLSTNPVSKDFTDVSYFQVSGQVTFKNTNCPSPNVHILVDGMWKATTGSDGTYAINNVQIGVHSIKPDPSMAHSFTPDSIIDTVFSPHSGVNFGDNFTRHLSGSVVGGCDVPLADSVKLVIHSNNTCKLNDEIIYTDSTGHYNIDLPPNQYTVTAGPVSYRGGDSITFPVKLVNLLNADTALNFIYHSPPEIEITGFEPYTDSRGWTIIDQFELYTIGISVYEKYYPPSGDTVKCRVDTGNVLILDDLSNTGIDTTIALSDTASVYTFQTGMPNILGGGDHPYQKNIQVQYVNDGSTYQTDKWVYILGQRPRQTNFTTTTPELPLLVLHDPPGDLSYSYLTEEQTVSEAISFSMKYGTGIGTSAKVSLGLDFNFAYGIGYEQISKLDVTLDFTSSFDLTMSQNSVRENNLTFTATNAYSTSASENFIGKQADLYMGGAMNLIYGITDILTIKDSINQNWVTVKPDIIIVPTGFATTYIYTESAITNNIIPSLYLIGDTASAHRWEGFVQRNTDLINSPSSADSTNYSFSAGTKLEKSRSVSQTTTQTNEFELLIDRKLAIDVGLKFDGIGFEGGVYVSTSLGLGASTVSSTTNTTTIGFVLEDDDGATCSGCKSDMISVDVDDDPVYGTPVFRLRSGQSSCPYEPGTTPRQGCSISPSISTQSGINPGDPAVFSLSLGNTSQTDEDGYYHLRVLSETNPHGAGISYPSDELHLYPGSSLSVDIFITWPTGSKVYDFTGIKIVLESTCDPGIGDTATINVHFTPPCSPVSILSPGNNWVVNMANNHILPVTITGYDTTNTQLQEIALEYSSDNGNTWIQVFSRPRSSIHTNTLSYNWNVDGFDDGSYMIRAAAKCIGAVVNYSERLSGIIDIHAPEVVGTPQPSDAVLGPGDEISYTFNEPLNPATVTINSCKLISASTGLPFSASVQYVAATHKIVFTFSPGQNYFIENQYFIAQVSGVKDKYGNSLATTANWTFLVDQGPLHWSPNSFPFSVTHDTAFTFNSTLSNTSANQIYYSLLTPGSITTSVLNGYLSAAGGNVPVGFTTQTMNPGDPHYDTIYATCLGYPEEKIYVSYSSPGFIQFAVDSATRHVTAPAGNTMFLINSNLAWSVTTASEWVHVTPVFGYESDTIFVSYDANPNNAVRTATITVKPEGVPLSSLNLSVIQAAAPPVVPPVANIQNITTSAGQTNCYNATQTITVAGNSTTFIVQDQGVANFIAGQAIYFKAGTKVNSGGKLTGKIAPNGPWCTPAKLTEVAAEAPVWPEPVETSAFIVYPNPTNGNFTVARRGDPLEEAVKIEAWSMTGDMVASDQMTGRKHEVEFRNVMPGLYFIRIMTSEGVESFKLIKTR